MLNRIKVFVARYHSALEAVVYLSVFGIAACAGIQAAKTGQPLDPVAVQQDLAMTNYLMRASGCVMAEAGTIAAPVVSIAADELGNQKLVATTAAGMQICTMVVPPTALPMPAPPNAPPVSAPLPTPVALSPTS